MGAGLPPTLTTWKSNILNIMQPSCAADIKSSQQQGNSDRTTAPAPTYSNHKGASAVNQDISCNELLKKKNKEHLNINNISGGGTISQVLRWTERGD